MILVDTSIWIDHLRTADPTLVSLLDHNGVLTHPTVIGELALGSLARRATVLTLLGSLPIAVRASDDEVLAFVDAYRLHSSGLSLVDAHLLASAFLTPDARLWTRDKRLVAVAGKLGIDFTPAELG